MEYEEKHLRFLATPDKGVVSAIFVRPLKSTHLLVLGHGASTNMNHQTMQNITASLAESNIATFRYNFPYSENGTGRNSNTTCIATVRSAVAAAHEAAPELPILAGGHSFGGRMTSTAQSEDPMEFVTGIIFFSYPLHSPDHPAKERAEHLNKIRIPMLFLSGTRDKLADFKLLKQVCEELGDLATLHLLGTADHGYKIQKRLRSSEEDVFNEMARVTTEWLGQVNLQT